MLSHASSIRTATVERIQLKSPDSVRSFINYGTQLIYATVGETKTFAGIRAQRNAYQRDSNHPYDVVICTELFFTDSARRHIHYVENNPNRLGSIEFRVSRWMTDLHDRL